VVAAATLAAPADRLQERLAALHHAVPMTGARLHGETWHPGRPPEPVVVDGDPLAAPDLVARFDLATQPPLRVVAGSGGTRLAVACHHAAFDGLSLLALLAALVRPQDHPDDPEAVGAVENQEPPTSPSATLPLRGPELRGLVGRLVRPADRVAPSPTPPGREGLAAAEVELSGPGVTARLAAAAVAAAGARNARVGRPWRRVGINVGLAGPAGAHGNRPAGRGIAPNRSPGDRAAGDQAPGNVSRYRRVDLRVGEAVGPALEAALARPREPLDQVWSPRWGWVLEPVVGRFSDSLLVSNLGRREVPGATRVEFFPVARGRSAVAVGAVGLAGGPATVSVRARDLSSGDTEGLLADLVARLAAGA
jgi:hypothetical protein